LFILLIENAWLYARLVQTSRELQRLTVADPLTGIANRRAFDEALEREWRRAVRNGETLSLMMIDIDYFKGYNDRYGHVAGDECLRTVASSLANNAHRSSDLAARYGGEEFAVLLPQVDAAAAARLAQRICQSVFELNIPHAGSQIAQCVTISIGLASMRPAQQSPDQKRPDLAQPTSLVLAADHALYAAKTAGRNRVFESELIAA
jgi:diguanylate cyclase (GGDEF)-like protein